MAISAKDVMALRQRTGLGMMDCKKALEETNGDMEAAVEMLRAKLKGKMDERTDRAAAEGRIAIAIEDDRSAVAIAELNTETDFTARNEKFGEATRKVAQIALDADAEGAIDSSPEMKDIIDNVRITTGENSSFRRAHKLAGGYCGSYLHHNEQVGVIVKFSGQVDDEVATGICQHITAHVPTPAGVGPDDIPSELMDKQRESAREEAAESGKPDNIIEKMIEGKLRKFVEENALLHQKYVKDPEGKKQVKDVLPKGVTIEEFVRYRVGG
ncbi:MAG: translation elongation factor Ts [Phycisphaerales bacterium]